MFVKKHVFNVVEIDGCRYHPRTPFRQGRITVTKVLWMKDFPVELFVEILSVII